MEDVKIVFGMLGGTFFVAASVVGAAYLMSNLMSQFTFVARTATLNKYQKFKR